MSLAWEIEQGNISAELGGDLDFYAKVTGAPSADLIASKPFNDNGGTLLINNITDTTVSITDLTSLPTANIGGGRFFKIVDGDEFSISFNAKLVIGQGQTEGVAQFGVGYTNDTVLFKADSRYFQGFFDSCAVRIREEWSTDYIQFNPLSDVEFNFTGVVGGNVTATITQGVTSVQYIGETLQSGIVQITFLTSRGCTYEITNYSENIKTYSDYSLTRPNDLGGTTGINTQNGAGDEYIFTKAADAEDFRDGWQIRATSGNESITTTFEVSEADPLAEPFTDNGFVFKGIDPEETETFATVEPGHKSTIALGMRRVDLVGGRIGWRDLGKRFDTYSIDFPSVIMNPDEAATFEALMKTPQSFYLRNYSGLAPLTPLLDPTGDIRFVVTGYDSRGYADDHAIANRYSLRGVAKYRDIYSTFPAQTAATSDCQTSRSSCTLAGVPFPIPDDGFRPNNNERPNGIALHGNATTLDRETKAFGETLELKIEADFVSARSLLYKLVELIRGGDIIFTAPEGSSPFGSQYDGAASYIVILASETIAVEKSVGDRFFVSVKLQLKEAA